jgi:hypothetical protein
MTRSEMRPCVCPGDPRHGANGIIHGRIEGIWGPAVSAQLISFNEFILQAVDIAARLDAISSRDNREEILPAVQRAKEDYAALVEQRNALLPADTSVLDLMLENLLARLKFFENRL